MYCQIICKPNLVMHWYGAFHGPSIPQIPAFCPEPSTVHEPLCDPSPRDGGRRLQRKNPPRPESAPVPGTFVGRAQIAADPETTKRGGKP